MRLCLALLLLLPAALQAAAAPQAVSFDRDIAPVLISRCLDCHSGAAPKGRLDLSRKKAALKLLVPGKPEESHLWQRVRDDEMPPKKPLAAAEKALLRAWIAAGAPWGADPVEPFRVSSAGRAGLDWWSLQPVRRPAPPALQNGSWAANPIDLFLLAKLQSRGLTPSPQAGRRTLIRRLSFDLLGLPPSPEEVTAFAEDARPDAYERLVDRLLANPHHGERWGRHWLDVVRYGESDGFERDLPRFNAWPYRDWVIRALNEDLRYDEFARLQLAGDLLRPGDLGALSATGFLVAGAHDVVVPVVESMRAAMRQDELEDIVGTVGQTFLGLTVHCARCHDHKFDPIPQRDYYRLSAALSGVRHGERPFISPATQERLGRLQREAERTRAALAALEEPVRRKLVAEGAKRPSPVPRPLAEWDFTTGLADAAGQLPVRLHGSARRTAAGLVVGGRDGYASTPPLKKDLREKTLEVWVRLADLKQRGGGVITLQTADGNVFDSVVFGEQQPGRWMAGSDFFRRTRGLDGTVEKEADGRPVHVALTYAGDGTITAYRDGVPYGRGYRSEGPVTFSAGKSHVLFGLRHGNPGGNRLLSGTIVRARIHARCLSAEEVAASFGRPVVRTADVLSRLDAEQRAKHAELSRRLEELSRETGVLGRQKEARIYAANSADPGVTRVLLRGDVTSPRDPVSAEVVLALSRLIPATGVGTEAGDAPRRTALARWISDARNPLFARVIANRLWHYHFGAGLVDTPSDFGFNGGRPSHPELLDWLAAELIESGWSLKHLHRLIVTSAAYRQDSRHRPEAARTDADNRLLWRKSPVRLEAEAVRDAMLAVTGQLDSTIGGSPYQDFRTYFFKGTQFYEPLDQVGERFTRRSVYRMWARGGRNPLLDTFDCPDPSATTPKRASTTTPLQALALFNNAFVLDQAAKFARRVRKEAGDDAGRQVARAYELALARQPLEREMDLVRPFVTRHGLEAFCRVLFNTGAFVQVD